MKTTKKPAKKAAKKLPAIKLIDGQYQIKQLIRLKPGHAEILERIKKIFSEKTVNGTIEIVLEQFDIYSKQNSDFKDIVSTLQLQVIEQNDTLTQLKKSFKLITDFDPNKKPKKKVATCIECGTSLNQFAQCTNECCTKFY